MVSAPVKKVIVSCNFNKTCHLALSTGPLYASTYVYPKKKPQFHLAIPI